MLPTKQRPCKHCGIAVIAPHAEYCPDCRWRYRIRRGLHPRWTPERDAILRERYDARIHGRVKEIALALHMPPWKVRRRAAELGLALPANERRLWTADEERFVWQHAGSRHVHWIATQLRRSVASVSLKMRRLRLSRRYREGYTLRELVLCFGRDHHVIRRWVAEGKLKVRRRGTAGDRDAWSVSDADLLAFIAEHPMAFPLRYVDQFWFMDLILNGKLVERALKAARAEEAVEESAA